MNSPVNSFKSFVTDRETEKQTFAFVQSLLGTEKVMTVMHAVTDKV